LAISAGLNTLRSVNAKGNRKKEMENMFSVKFSFLYWVTFN